VSALPPLVSTTLALLVVATVVALVGWALSLMQAANDRQEFSLMLAGCMVCSAAVGLATVMVLTVSSPYRLMVDGLTNGPFATGTGISLDSVALPWDTSLDCLVEPARCPGLPSS